MSHPAKTQPLVPAKTASTHLQTIYTLSKKSLAGLSINKPEFQKHCHVISRNLDSAVASNVSPDLRTPNLLSIPDMISIRPPPWLVDSFLPSAATAFLYGTEAVGKTFAAIDLAFSVARGIPFCNMTTKQGTVLYVVAEGVFNFSSRVAAYIQRKGAPGLEFIAPIFFMPEAPQLNTPMGRQAILYAIDAINVVPDLLIIDTFHACMATADETDSASIGDFIVFANQLAMRAGITTLAIHHKTKGSRGTKSTYRGHSSIAGAASTMIEMSTKGHGMPITITCGKQKDSAYFQPINGILEQVTLPDTRTSCVFQHAPSSKPSAHVRQLLMLQPLRAAKGPLQYVEWLRATGIPDRTFDRLRQKLMASGHVLFNDGGYSAGPNANAPLSDDPDTSAEPDSASQD